MTQYLFTIVAADKNFNINQITMPNVQGNLVAHEPPLQGKLTLLSISGKDPRTGQVESEETLEEVTTQLNEVLGNVKGGKDLHAKVGTIKKAPMVDIANGGVTIHYEPRIKLPQATKYSIKMVNASSSPWTFYVYQQVPSQSPSIFSLAWFASPIIIGTGKFFTASWYIDYSFVWAMTGVLQPGITFTAGEITSCDPLSANDIIFSDVSNTPGFSTPTYDPASKGSLVIHDDPTVPNSTFSVGIGMAGQGTFAVEAGGHLRHYFTPTPQYWIAAGSTTTVGDVLDIKTVTQTKQVNFGSGPYTKTATLQSDYTWLIT